MKTQAHWEELNTTWNPPSKQNHELQSRRCLILSLCLRKAFGKCLRGSNMKNYNLQLKALIDSNLLFHQHFSFFDLCDYILWCDLLAQPSSPNSVVNLSCTSRSDLLTVGLCLARTLSKSVLDIGGGTIFEASPRAARSCIVV